MTAPLADPAVRRLALVRLRVGLGDLLCTVPALRRLRAVRPDVEVTLVTFGRMAPVVARLGGTVDHLLPGSALGPPYQAVTNGYYSAYPIGAPRTYGIPF